MKTYNPTTTKWLGTHCVSARTAAMLLRHRNMGSAWIDLDEFQKFEVMKANNRRSYTRSLDITINPFTKLRSDPTIIPCDFCLSDGVRVTGRYWEEGQVILVTSRGLFKRGTYAKLA